MKNNKDRQGAAVVEFAILLVLILLILAGVVEFGFLWLQSHYINNAAREGARIAAKTEDPTVPGPDNDAVKKAVIDYLFGLYPKLGDYKPSDCCGCDNPSDRICSVDIEQTTAGTTKGYTVTIKVKISRIFGGTGEWFFALFSPGDTGDIMTGSAFFADETP
ncbi:MAG: pilus assembly protein [Desulfobulbaceae bacterium]|nr:pilus assembly protein [Desulfobulbaceae bacterium]